LLPDPQWQRTEAYNEVDRQLGIRDMAAIYQTTAAGQLLALTVGRSGPFRASELEPLRKLQRILAALPPLRPGGSRLIPAGQSGLLVQSSEILCITAADNHSTLLTVDNRTIKVRQSLAGWLALLPAGTFLQAGRSTLINLGHISRVQFGTRCATVCFDVPVPALVLGRNAAQKLKRALQPP
jgi:DNA-binding LytR/AlgR family response regulator